ncbi:MAG: DNA repair exonuclease [Dehalococcoidales bacterium]|nr:MAG: DNA repair exonuclease [Dehalococcoidales bacterium]
MPDSRAQRRRKRRILHTSDLHLDRIEDKACDSLTAIVNLAISERVDMVIIAGDLFDHNRVENDLVSFVVKQLRRLPVPVVILPGNHDCLVPGSVYEQAEFRDSVDIHVIGAPQGETLDLPELEVSIWGKCIDSYDADVLPLEGIPQPQGNGRWHVAIAHGYYVDKEPPLFYSYHISHKEVIDSGRDYIALGHLPMFRGVCFEPVAYYSGSPSMSGSVALVELDEEAGVQVTQCMLEGELT